ncbi:hypothetical protein ACRWDS_09000, partial [Escherichia coli]
IICSPMTSLKTSIKTITYLSDIGCLEIQGASLWGKVLGEDNSITHLVVYPEVLSLVFDAANTYNAEPGVLEQTARAYIESHGAVERHLGCSDF